MSNPCTFDDQEYPSVLAAAKAAGVSSATMAQWLARGYTTKDEAVAAKHSRLKGYHIAARERGVTRQAEHLLAEARKRREQKEGVE